MHVCITFLYSCNTSSIGNPVAQGRL